MIRSSPHPAQPTTLYEATRYLYSRRAWVTYFGAWVKVSVKRADGDIVFAIHRVGVGGDENFALLAATRNLWEQMRA